jgi:CRISPR/Cas system CSM-associated protein Csm2 small subunit
VHGAASHGAARLGLAWHGKDSIFKENNVSKIKATKTYSPVVGSPLSQEQAERYGSRIDLLIEQNNGMITPELVVTDAASKKSPLHDYFQWDDAKAAEEYRLTQAGQLLRFINVTYNDEEKPAKAYHNVVVTIENKSQRGYVNLQRVLSEEELLEQVLKQALKEIKTWREKYRQYKSLGTIVNLVSAIDTVVGI